MDRRMKKKFQVIGACTKMQTLSLEEEFSLLQGIPYDLDIFSDFSAWQLKGSGIQDVSTSDLCRMLVETENTCQPVSDSGKLGFAVRRALWRFIPGNHVV